jgi:deoxyribodipyrimidine photo-lyase
MEWLSLPRRAEFAPNDPPPTIARPDFRGSAVPTPSLQDSQDPRLRVVRPGAPDLQGRCVVYWMQGAQRGRDNSALNHAIEPGNALKQPVLAVFGLTADYPEAERRHYRFLVDGLTDARDDLEARGVPLVVRIGSPSDVALAVAHEAGASILVGDENPVRSE